jgi:hypothetical protein
LIDDLDSLKYAFAPTQFNNGFPGNNAIYAILDIPMAAPLPGSHNIDPMNVPAILEHSERSALSDFSYTPRTFYNVVMQVTSYRCGANYFQRFIENIQLAIDKIKLHNSLTNTSYHLITLHPIFCHLPHAETITIYRRRYVELYFFCYQKMNCCRQQLGGNSQTMTMRATSLAIGI